MTPSNPFTKMRPATMPAPDDASAFAHFGMVYGAEALWDLLGELPNKPEATLAQRRLEEAVFWAGRAAELRP